MIEYLFLRGIKVIFLPAYCPFFNPIEILFGNVKRRCRELYDPKKRGSEEAILRQVMQEYENFDCLPIFQKCGYEPAGYFNCRTNRDLFIEEADMVETDFEDQLELVEDESNFWEEF
eukprot:Pompholyxophrys_sp_v1_NODE_28_length_3713_cov_6.285128.p4 type:complete len:117 gc:universal NODE_28_length_3713_cov_6.285128:2376-2026(-)